MRGAGEGVVGSSTSLMYDNHDPSLSSGAGKVVEVVGARVW